MIPSLKMTGTYSLYACVLLFYTVGSFSQVGSFAQDVSRCSSWVQDHDSENNLDTSVALWEKNDCPFIDCAMLCNQDQSCVSFFHHPSLQLCLGTQSYKRGLPSSKTTQQGWQYYSKPQQCDGDYVFNQSLGLCYKFHVDVKTFNDAMAACEAEGAKMLVLRNRNELNFIITVISSKIGTGTYAYLGLRAIGVNRAWKWFNGQDETYLPWAVGEPDNYFGDDNCMIFLNVNYHDDPCSRLRPFVCQRFIK